ncbi:FCS-Like Zinc finger 11-like [Oryza brachyantha]|uniref:FCS-Like Zinc finger 11-like n=1 Tax=Oryza brachyantha TaxID=4533 RepID=UPI001AD988BF|nr:FCS-Like Zinc finger 11-like [Oryza brachyantha]XP_040380172.1 FCS-Like Zinc finger 11-like [Oryza brachyantha]
MLRKVVVVPDAGDAADGAGKPRSAAAFFKVPRLLVGLAAARCECDSPARSPTSPLDLRAFAALGGGPLPRSPRSWDARRAGLGGLIDGLPEPGAAENRLLGPQMRRCVARSFPSQPRACGPVQPELGKAGDAVAGGGGMSVPCSRFYGDVKSGPEVTVSGGAQLGVNAGRAADLGKFPATGSLPASIGCPPRYIGSVSATEVEQSEDYTRIIARGPNPKTTHIFGDCILEPCTESYWLVKLSGSGEELRRVCSYCKKKLDGNDLCFYRGEKSFCSGDCRDQEILIEDEEESNTAISSPISIGSASSFHDDLFMAGMAVLDMSTSSPHA